VFVKVANGPGLGAAPARRAPHVMRNSQGTAVIRMPIVIRARPARGFGAVDPSQVAGLFTRPGPNGGTELVSANGNVVYSEDQVNANPGLLQALQSSNPCGNGTMPVYFPGGESTCGDPSALIPGVGNSPLPQFEYPINGSCNPNVWCLTGTDPTNPNSYTWNGSGTPTVMNPALVMTAGTIPAGYGGSVVHSDPVAIVPATVTFQNTSRPGQPFQVGDSWQLTIKGTANQPVSGTVSQNGKSLGTTAYGSTDSTGQLVLTGSMDSTTVGSWSELWTVGTTSAPVLTFSVSSAPTPAPSGSGSSGGGSSNNTGSSNTGGGSSNNTGGSNTGGGSNTTPAPAPAAATGSLSDFFTQSVTIGGVSIPMWALFAGGGAALLLFSGGGRR
jgi:hypothetical protein